jgi:hypothetical protein
MVHRRSTRRGTSSHITNSARAISTRALPVRNAYSKGHMRYHLTNMLTSSRTFVGPYLKPDGTMLVEGTMQAPFTVRRNVAAVLGLPVNAVRVHSISMGRGFGGKEDSPVDLCCRAALLASYKGKPVRILPLEQEEVTLQTSKRHPNVQRSLNRPKLVREQSTPLLTK